MASKNTLKIRLTREQEQAAWKHHTPSGWSNDGAPTEKPRHERRNRFVTITKADGSKTTVRRLAKSRR